MTETTRNHKTWTLWVYAGPGARDDGTLGQVISLSDAIGTLPPDVGLLGETVGDPTLLQRLTGAWPTQRLALGAGDEHVPAAERNLRSFIEWAETRTPKESKRALIILGDLLKATGEETAEAVKGPYRPGYPKSITIRDKPDASYSEYTLNQPKSSTAKDINSYMYSNADGTIKASFPSLLNRTDIYIKLGPVSVPAVYGYAFIKYNIGADGRYTATSDDGSQGSSWLHYTAPKTITLADGTSKLINEYLEYQQNPNGSLAQINNTCVHIY